MRSAGRIGCLTNRQVGRAAAQALPRSIGQTDMGAEFLSPIADGRPNPPPKTKLLGIYFAGDGLGAITRSPARTSRTKSLTRNLIAIPEWSTIRRAPLALSWAPDVVDGIITNSFASGENKTAGHSGRPYGYRLGRDVPSTTAEARIARTSCTSTRSEFLRLTTCSCAGMGGQFFSDPQCRFLLAPPRTHSGTYYRGTYYRAMAWRT